MNTNSTSNPGFENDEPAGNENVEDQNLKGKKPVKSQTRGGNSSNEKVMIDPMTDLQAIKNPG